MKVFFISMLMVISASTSFAQNNVFRLNSPVPATLQSKILSQISKNCAGLSKGSLSEVESTSQIKTIDQGIRDTYYSTKLSYTYYFDGAHPANYDIYVSSAEYDISNPSVDRFEVINISGLSSDICAE